MYYEIDHTFDDAVTLLPTIKTIPFGTTDLAMYWRNLGNKPVAELVEAFKALPASITSLDLWQNDLSKKTGAELAEVFKFPYPELTLTYVFD